MPSPPQYTKSALILQAQRALGTTQTTFGELVGVSRRTVARWCTAPPGLGVEGTRIVVAAVHPIDPPLAASIAVAYGHTLESLGVVVPEPPAPVTLRQEPPPPPPLPPPPPPPPLPPPVSAGDLADSIVCAAAEAAGLAPQAIRPALIAAFDRAASVRLDVEEVRAALGPAAAGKKKAP